MSAPIDLARLIDMSDGDLQFEREILTLYFTTAERYVLTMRDSLDKRREWSHAAHSLKGASRNIGAVAVGDLAEQAEHGDPSPETVRHLEDALQASLSFLARRHPETPVGKPAR